VNGLGGELMKSRSIGNSIHKVPYDEEHGRPHECCLRYRLIGTMRRDRSLLVAFLRHKAMLLETRQGHALLHLLLSCLVIPLINGRGKQCVCVVVTRVLRPCTESDAH
jgi:hypothetical protein